MSVPIFNSSRGKAEKAEWLFICCHAVSVLYAEGEVGGGVLIFDYVIVGSGLFGSVFAHEAGLRGKKCLVLERRDHIGGNVYTYERVGINIHRYGAHIFHTSDKEVWNYINRFAEFNNYINSPIANYKGEIYNMPFNMNTFSKMWGIRTPDEAKAIIEEQRKEVTGPIDKQ